MNALAFGPIVVVLLLMPSSSAVSKSFVAAAPGLELSTGGDSLEVVLAEALNRADLPLADKIIESQSKLDSNAMQWHFFRGMRSYIEVSYEHDRQNEETMRKVELAMEKAVEIGEKRLAVNPEDSIALFYTGGAYGYLGMAQLRSGSMFKAGSAVMASVKSTSWAPR